MKQKLKPAAGDQVNSTGTAAGKQAKGCYYEMPHSDRDEYGKDSECDNNQHSPSAKTVTKREG